MGDVPVIDVSILLFSLLSLRPSALANFLNCVQKKRQSSCGTTALRSSTYARRLVIPPSLSSSKILFNLRVCALCLNFLSSFSIMVCNTNAANTGLKGHPCGNPSFCRKCFHLPLGLR